MGKFNQDELNPPEWMDREFFAKVLRNSENDGSIKVNNVDITPATKMGDHYASVMFRGTISYDSQAGKNQEKSLIVKTMPFEEGMKKDLLADSHIFETEISMYKTLGKFEEILRKAGDNTVLGAKVLYSALEPMKYIIFEDLKKKGFATLDNRVTTLEESKAAMTKLAKWHAISYKLHHEGDESVSQYTEGIFSLPMFIDAPIMINGINMFIDTLKTLPGYEEYVPKFEKIRESNLVQRCVNIYDAVKQGESINLCILNHGDFHAKNMMFKHDEGGKLRDLMLVDFQLCVWAPAIIDLTYMAFMLLSPEDRRNKREEMIYHYYQVLVETLKKTGFKGKYPTLTGIYQDMFKFKDFEIFIFTTFLPMTYAFTGQSDVEFDPDTMMKSEEYRLQFYKDPRFIEEVKRMLPIYLHRGYLD